MTDYEKLTVIKLREGLVQRGLPKTGLKAALIQRLQEADAQLGSTDPAPATLATKQPDRTAQDAAPASQEVLEPVATPNNESAGEDANASNGAPQASEVEPDADEDASGTAKAEVAGREENKVEKEPKEVIQASRNEQVSAQLSADLPMGIPVSGTPDHNPQVEQDSQSDILPGVMTQPAQETDPPLQLPTPVQTQTEQSSMTPMTSTQELLEDSRKRKRRSQSPPPSSIETQKRLKADISVPHVSLPEDTKMEDNTSNHSLNGNATSQAAIPSDSKPQTNGHRSAKVERVTPQRDATAAVVEDPMIGQENHTISQPKSTESPVKPSPSDTRFKNLFPAPSKPDQTSPQPPYQDNEDRVIGPALHPATSALYIRELMRPLKPESIRDHLAALATPPDASVDPSIITNFFLDAIRTHCLVGFANISAASRVRSALHDRIWPNERDRRPLYVDFVPEEKLKKWIDVEQNAPSGRGHPQKRWEVVYEDEDGTIMAYLQEVGTNSGGLRATMPPRADAGQGVKGAPSGPRMRESEPRAAPPRPDHGKGFQALDDLFKSTTAKPKLYYQPVPKSTADQRLDRLAAGRGGGRSDEMRRYTFEGDLLVDKAPEFGNRGRGGFGGRGGFSGSYRGRGGGYRGDGYRDVGDSWRDRRSGY